MTFSARTTTDRILAIVPPITAFVAAGFEHSIANMYFIPVALFIMAGAPAAFWTAIGKTAADFPNLTGGPFLVNNLLPVTLGNIVGGAVLVGAVYWYVYLRNAASPAAPAEMHSLATALERHNGPDTPRAQLSTVPVGPLDNGRRKDTR